MKQLIFILGLCSWLFAACDDDDRIDCTIWIEDEHNHHLPAYTQWGYNTFGARVNDGYFVSQRYGYRSACRFESENDTLSFELIGYNSYYYYDDNIISSISFIFEHPHVIDYGELKSLSNKTLDLASEDVFVGIKTKDSDKQLIVERGTLKFNNVLILRIDEEEEEAVVSGTFEIYGRTDDGEKYHITKGRFDLGVSERNLF